ncbi:metallophosphoesterase [Tissierella sp.]|uniref:metallophosphoesterase n=1 Tax=Tissierella sp. TaxID=41274 RepID=UPI002859264D|nr:metallophosphoesterase [Tissierella sp.]MDR7856510.1 metallophosphoesterase family protein [Tissierella sp.]
MRTDERLTNAYNSARIEYFDKNSKYIFFSDCHRGTGGHADEFSKNQNVFKYALEHYFRNGYTYVEAGDGDELWEYPRVKDIKNAHFDIFETIKKFHNADRFIMIYGNHNIYLKNEDYVKRNYYSHYNEYKEETSDFLPGLKPCEAVVLKNKNTNQEIFVVHGHQGDFANDQLWSMTMLSLKYFWKHLHSFGIKNPASPVKNTYKRHKIERNYNKWIRKNKKMLICGHTHRFKFPRKRELPYFNTGCCIYPSIISGIEISEGNVQLIRWKTLVNEEGILQISKAVLRGPEPIEKFDIR